MRIMMNAQHLAQGTFGMCGESGSATLTLCGAAPEEAFEAAARLGMKREGACAVRVEGEKAASVAAQALMGWFHGAYRFSKAALRDLKRFGDVFALRDELCDYGSGELVIDCDEDIYDSLGRAATLARCEGYARTLGNLPNNYLHAAEMSKYICDMAESCGLKVCVLGNRELEKLGCGGVLAVNQGCDAEAKLVILEHRAGEASPIALVGKGVLFDSGGYHLKSIGDMNGMKLDMCGAATVAAAMEYAARTKSDQGLIAVIPLVENVVGPNAVKMGDVITALSGKTVEIYNTDAEGRLILSDALAYAQRMGARRVFDIATLTYGAQGALGNDCGAYFSNNEDTARAFEAVAKKCGECIWRLPLGERYHAALRWTEVADIANYAPGYGATASVAACFLEEFIEADTQWVHIDIVGPANRREGCDTACRGATGYGLRMLAEICG